MCCWDLSVYDMYNNRKHRVYSMCCWIHLQYNYKCCVLYSLCCRLYRRHHLSVYCLYYNDE